MGEVDHLLDSDLRIGGGLGSPTKKNNMSGATNWTMNEYLGTGTYDQKPREDVIGMIT